MGPPPYLRIDGTSMDMLACTGLEKVLAAHLMPTCTIICVLLLSMISVSGRLGVVSKCQHFVRGHCECKQPSRRRSVGLAPFQGAILCRLGKLYLYTQQVQSDCLSLSSSLRYLTHHGYHTGISRVPRLWIIP